MPDWVVYVGIIEIFEKLVVKFLDYFVHNLADLWYVVRPSHGVLLFISDLSHSLVPHFLKLLMMSNEDHIFHFYNHWRGVSVRALHHWMSLMVHLRLGEGRRRRLIFNLIHDPRLIWIVFTGFRILRCVIICIIIGKKIEWSVRVVSVIQKSRILEILNEFELFIFQILILFVLVINGNNSVVFLPFPGELLFSSLTCRGNSVDYLLRNSAAFKLPGFLTFQALLVLLHEFW